MKRLRVPGAIAIGLPRPSLPVQVFAEDLSLIIRAPRRIRLARGIIRVLH